MRSCHRCVYVYGIAHSAQWQKQKLLQHPCFFQAMTAAMP